MSRVMASLHNSKNTDLSGIVGNTKLTRNPTRSSHYGMKVVMIINVKTRWSIFPEVSNKSISNKSDNKIEWSEPSIVFNFIINKRCNDVNEAIILIIRKIRRKKVN